MRHLMCDADLPAEFTKYTQIDQMMFLGFVLYGANSF